MNDHFRNEQLSYHGGVDSEELQSLKLDPSDVLDLSSNVLMIQHPAEMREALHASSIARYPDRKYAELRQSIAKYHHTHLNRIWVGNGASELIHLIAHTLNSADTAVVLGPTFSEYERASRLSGAGVHVVLSVDNKFEVCGSTVTQALQRFAPSIVWICNPNNPTGRSIDSTLIEQWLREFPATLFVVDESYQPFSREVLSMAPLSVKNLLVLRSMTKCFALAGIRLGYVVGDESRIEDLISRSVPWSVSSIATAAGLAALQHSEHFESAIREMHGFRADLIEGLFARGFLPIPTDANYVLLPVEDAVAFRRSLLPLGVIVRDCTSFGLPQHVRIAVGDRAAMVRLFAAMDQTIGRERVPVAGLCK